jgi:hypothetical protein
METVSSSRPSMGANERACSRGAEGFPAERAVEAPLDFVHAMMCDSGRINSLG